MRSIHLGLYALFTSAVLMVSCAEDELIENNHHLTSSETINFDAIVEWPKDYMDSRSATSSLKRVESPKLRAEEGNETLPMGVYVQDGIYPITTANPESRGAVITKGDLNSFNVWATLNKAQSVGGGSIEYFANETFESSNGVFSSTGTTYYWPGEGPTIDFLAVGNANDAFVPDMEGASGTFDYTVPAAATAQNDIVVAKAPGIAGDKNESVSLDFQHIMSAVNVKVGSEMTAGTINSITFKNIKSTGTYDVANETWKNVGTPTSYTVTFGEGSNTVTESTVEGTLINGTDATFMMIPQALTDASETEKVEIIVNFTYATTGNEKNLKASLSDQEWAQGKTTNYYINVSPDFTLSIEEESVPTADCHYDIREITISDESNVGWTLTSDVDWVKFRVKSADYSTNTNYTEYKDFWVESHTVQNIEVKVTSKGNNANPDISTEDKGTIDYKIDKSINGRGTKTVLIYFYENTGSSSSDSRKTRIKLLGEDNKEYGYIDVSQFYPLWNNTTMAYERIEENDNTYPWGFASSRTITYTYPSIDYIWGKSGFFYELLMFWKKGGLTGLGKLIYNYVTRDAKSARSDAFAYFETTYKNNATAGFITMNGNANSEWSVTLNYEALNGISTTSTGYNNTLTILSSTGGGTSGSNAETWLKENNFTTDGGSSSTDNTTLEETAAYQAIKKNAWNLSTIVKTTITYDENGKQQGEPNVEIITDRALAYGVTWFLPSNAEIATLKPTACDADATNNDEPLSGTYWTSTSAADVKAYEYAADATSGTPVSRVATTKHKIRAACMKPITTD